ncbi:glycosyl transferase 2 family protein [Clostridium sp. CAG:343]|jgi:glycosyltransferase involved in cell wall biosynthesis|nr:glycosyl transferase 2 family protein [Clostridium sp. CAG:343]HCF34355.1 glycosyl transferase family 2 [Clostridiales bacterium]
MPKVSIIVPVYNVEKYIEKCLTSLVNQTLEDIEIIVVNDGSKDNSKKIIEEFIQRYQKKIVYLEKENGGLSDARNYGIPYAKGEYIAFLDSDDYVEKDTYKRMYELAKKEKSDMVECDFYWEYPNKTKIDTGEIYHNKKEMLEKVRVVAWNKLIKREILEKSKIEFPKGYRYEDVEFTYKLIPYLEKVSFLKEPCIHYIQRENSISNLQNARTKEIFDVLEHVINYYKDKNIYDEYEQQLEYIYARYLLCSSLLRIVKIKDKETRNNLLDVTWKKLNAKFPNWKENKILKKNNNVKNLYMKTVNKVTYKIYSKIFRGI